MNTQATPDSHLLLNVSPTTKARVVESMFPNPNACYADEITHNLTRVKRILTGFSRLGGQEDEQITGELAMALSELLEQQVDIAITLLHGSIYDHKEAA